MKQKSLKVNAKGWRLSAQNRERTASQAVFETSAHRELSRLEHDEAEALQGAGVIMTPIDRFVCFEFLLNKRKSCWDGIHNRYLIHHSSIQL